MHDHWPAAGKQRVEAGVPRGAGYVEADWGGQQKPQGCCSHCPADVCGLRHNRCSMQANVTCASASVLCSLCNLREAVDAFCVFLMQSIQCLHVKCTS